MLTKNSNPKISYLSRILALPLMALLVLAFTVKEKKQNSISLAETINVVIDAGHGGGTGAHIGDVTEDEIVLQLAKTIESINTNNKVKIFLTRENNTQTELPDRLEFIKAKKADLLISLHLGVVVSNSTQARTSGIEVKVGNKSNLYEKQSVLLASALVQQLSQAYNTYPNLGKAGAFVLNQNVCPSVMVDCGYLTNYQDRNFISKKENQKVIAEKILTAIENFASALTSVDNPSSHLRSSRKNLTDAAIPSMPNSGGTTKDTSGNSALVIIDGEEVGILNSFSKLSQLISPDKIESINILKGATAIAKYGEKGKDGVIEIISKTSNNTRHVKEITLPNENPISSEKRSIEEKKTNQLEIKEVVLDEVFEQVEQPAQFPGGNKGWMKFLLHNLDPAVPIDRGAKPGNYRVEVMFNINKAGEVFDIKTLTNHGYGMEEEALRAFKNTPKWIPAKQNGKPVSSISKKSITFVIQEQ